MQLPDIIKKQESLGEKAKKGMKPGQKPGNGKEGKAGENDGGKEGQSKEGKEGKGKEGKSGQSGGGNGQGNKDGQNGDDGEGDAKAIMEIYKEQQQLREALENELNKQGLGGQGFVFAGLGFALEEAARDLAGGVGLLDVIHRQGEEVLAGLGGLGGDHSGQHHGVVNIHQHGAGGLAGDLARFHDDGLVAPLERLGDFVENAHY